MRITFLIPSIGLSGGIRVVVDYAKRLSAQGHDVTLVWPAPSQPAFVDRAKQTLVNLLKFNRGAKKPHGADKTYLNQDLHGCRLVECTTDMIRPSDVPDADVVVATWCHTVNWLSDFPASKGIKIHFIQGDDTTVPGLEEFAKAAWRKKMAHQILVAPWLESRVRELLGDVPMSVVLNGVDLQFFAAPSRSKQSPVRVGYMYSPGHIKGCDIIAEALSLVKAQVPDLQIVAFGADTPTLQMPLAQGVEFHLRPSQEEIPKIYASCDVWIWGSRVEGFGLPLLEAMACRTPVVATDAGAANALVRQGGGRLVPIESPTEMANAVLEYCHMSPDEWQRHSQAAHQFIQTRSIDIAALEFLAVLKSTVAAHALS
jgi:glycosyltransferase involved in cell wall biosynthesis